MTWMDQAKFSDRTGRLFDRLSHTARTRKLIILRSSRLSWPLQKHLRRERPLLVRSTCNQTASVDLRFTIAKPSPKDSKAKAAKKAALQGANSHSKRKTRLSVSFHRPKTLRLPRDPKYPRTSVPHAPRMDQFRTIVSYVEHCLRGCM